MHESRMARTLPVGVLILAAQVTAAWAVEVKSGDANQASANASAGQKVQSQIVVSGGFTAPCAFTNAPRGGTIPQDNHQYHSCFENWINSWPGDYHAFYDWQQSLNTLSILGLNSAEIEGLCYEEWDPDLQWIEIALTDTPPVPMVAKFRRVPTQYSSATVAGQMIVWINEDQLTVPLPVDSQLDQALVDALNAYAAIPGNEAFTVLDQIANYIVVETDSEGDPIERIGISIDDLNATRSQIALEPWDSNPSNYQYSYCNPE